MLLLISKSAVSGLAATGRRSLSTRAPLYGQLGRANSLLSSQQVHITLRSNRSVPAIAPLTSSCSLSSDSGFYGVIKATEASFEAVHTLTHLPWWAVVVTSTVVLRSLLTLPLAVYQSRVLAKMELLLPTLKEYQEAVKHNVIVKCRRANLPVEEANRRLKKEARHNRL